MKSENIIKEYAISRHPPNNDNVEKIMENDEGSVIKTASLHDDRCTD